MNSEIHAEDHASPRNVYDENKRNKEREKEKNDGCLKIFLMTGRTLYGCCRSYT